MDNSSVTQNRRSSRSNVFLAATLEVSGLSIPVKLRNLSAEGALIQGEQLPTEGTELLFKRNELCELGRVVWAKGSHAGIAFKDKLHPEQVLRHVPTPRPVPPMDCRRPGFGSRNISAEEMRLIENWLTTSSSRQRLGD